MLPGRKLVKQLIVMIDNLAGVLDFVISREMAIRDRVADATNEQLGVLSVIAPRVGRRLFSPERQMSKRAT